MTAEVEVKPMARVTKKGMKVIILVLAMKMERRSACTRLSWTSMQRL